MIRDRHSRRITFLVFYGSLLLLAYLAYRILEPFLVQIGWALVLAICLDPVQQRLRPRLGNTRTALLLTVLVIVLLVVPIVFAGLALLGEGQDVVTNIKAQLENRGGAAAWLHTAWDWARGKVPMLPPEEEAIARVTTGMGDMAGFLASRAGGLLKGAALFLFDLLITLGILFFLLRDSSSFAASFRRLLPFGEDQNERLVTLTRDLVSASVTATLAIAAVQGIIGGVTFALLGIQSAAVWGLIMAILSFLPLVGATLVWLPAAVWLVLSGSLGKGIALLVVGVVFMGHVDNVVRPLLLSGTSKMNTLVLIMSLMGGLSAFGFIGIVLGPLVAAVVTALVESYAPPPTAGEPAATGSSAPVAVAAGETAASPEATTPRNP
jgi:predicted PurR-regulated permease PerM